MLCFEVLHHFSCVAFVCEMAARHAALSWKAATFSQVIVVGERTVVVFFGISTIIVSVEVVYHKKRSERDRI